MPCKKNISVIVLLLFPILWLTAQTNSNHSNIERYKMFVTSTTTSIAPKISNRKAWKKVAKTDFGKQELVEAQELLNVGFPEWNDSIYQTFYKTGLRAASDNFMQKRQSYMPALVLAECIQNKGIFLPLIEQVITELCQQPTWVLAAHDVNKSNYQGKFGVDLHAATMASQIGLSLYMLDEKLSPEVKKLATETLYTRIINPTFYNPSNNKQWWWSVKNNWNSVGLGGVVSAALCVETDIEKRALYITEAEKQINYFIDGYLNDGYCVEGLGYHTYGFSYFLLLRESVYKATNGKVDLFDNEKVSKMALFPLKSEIANGIYPAISDCGANPKLADWMLYYCNKNYNWGLQEYSKQPLLSNSNHITNLVALFGNSPSDYKVNKVEHSKTLRSYYESIGLFYARPNAKQANQMAIAIMAGSNGHFSHNHNDLGTYNIVLGDKLMMGDMGGPTSYTSKTFSKERYTLYKSFSSMGHPVPLVNGIEQYESKLAEGVLVDSVFSDKHDKVVFELKSGYQCNELRSLQREMNYYRNEQTVIEVADRFVAEKPIAFETALTTMALVDIQDNIIYLSSGDKKIEITVQAPCAVTISQTTIEDYKMPLFTRIGIALNEKTDQAEIKLTYKIVATDS